MTQRILDEVAQGMGNGVRITANHRALAALLSDGAPFPNGERRHACHDVSRCRSQVEGVLLIDDEIVRLRRSQHLIDQPDHRIDVRADHTDIACRRQRVEPRRENGKRRPQGMGHFRGEGALGFQRSSQPFESRVCRLHESLDFRR